MSEFSIQDAYGKKTTKKKQEEFSAEDAYAPKEDGYFSGFGKRMVDAASSSFNRAVQGVGDIAEGGVTRGAEKGNVLTGIPRLALGAIGTIASPITAAVGPVLEPLVEPLVGEIDTYVGKPVEQATGYPSDITNELAIQLLTAGTAKGVRSALPKTTPANAAIAQNLLNQDIPVFPGQLASSKMIRNAHDLSDQLSFYDNGRLTAQQDAVSTALARTMGENTPDLRTALAQSNERLGGVTNPQNPLGPKLRPGTYDEIYSRIGDHPIDQVARGEMVTLANRAAGLTPRTTEQINRAIMQVLQSQRNGRLTVAGFKDLTDQGGVLSELSGSANPAIARYGDQLRAILERNIARSANPSDAALLRQADRQWRHMKTLEPAIARGANAEGQIPLGRLQSDIASASGKMNARNASGMPELEALAEAGQGFLKPPKTSGTAERSAIAHMITGQGLLAGGGYLAGGPVAAVASLLLPIGVRRVLQSQGITRAMIAEALHRGANPNALRRALMNAARDARFTAPAGAAISNSQENRDQ
jgi:hypothetical protein